MPGGKTNVWNTSAANRIVDEKLLRERHDKHLKALSTIQPSVDNRPPAEFQHLKDKLKTKKLQEDRAAEIQLENRILLQKMLNIDTKYCSVSGEVLEATRVPPRSLHAGYRKKEMSRITEGNRELLRRLQGATPSYDPLKWDQDERDREGLKYRLSQNAHRYNKAQLHPPPRQRAGGGSRQRYDSEDGGLLDDELNRQMEEFKMQSMSLPMQQAMAGTR
mmetsp:Transcript_22134/g.50593  ORF Transcript_22134/g.50593 Transcript_22134/m.50593 type:complete len:219 (-) Transcript_22134:188-844(-)